MGTGARGTVLEKPNRLFGATCSFHEQKAQLGLVDDESAVEDLGCASPLGEPPVFANALFDGINE